MAIYKCTSLMIGPFLLPNIHPISLSLEEVFNTKHILYYELDNFLELGITFSFQSLLSNNILVLLKY